LNEWDIIARWYRLRKLGLLWPLLHEPGGHFYRFDDYGLWNSRERIKTEDLIAAIVSEEDKLSANTQSIRGKDVERQPWPQTIDKIKGMG
jgi:hypothetical protein